MPRADKGISRGPRADKGKPRGPRGKYKSKLDETGKTRKENAVERAFWGRHKLADIMVMDSSQLEKVLDQVYEEYEARQIRRDPKWNYPIERISSMANARKKRLNVDKGWHL